MPEVSTQTTPEGAVIVEPSAHVSHGGGSSRPGVCESPAKVARDSAHTSAHADKIRLNIGESPLVNAVEGLSGFAARTAQVSTQTDPDLVLFRALADRKDFDALTQLCRERLLAARDALASLRWTKDRAIVEDLRGNFTAAYDLLASASYAASEVSGRPRGKYENEFGIVLARLGRGSLALDHFGRAYHNSRAAGDLSTCAHVDHNRARALFTRGEQAKAVRYIKRALDYARANNDYRLEGEICESLVEFGEGAR